MEFRGRSPLGSPGIQPDPLKSTQIHRDSQEFDGIRTISATLRASMALKRILLGIRTGF